MPNLQHFAYPSFLLLSRNGVIGPIIWVVARVYRLRRALTVLTISLHPGPKSEFEHWLGLAHGVDSAIARRTTARNVSISSSISRSFASAVHLTWWSHRDIFGLASGLNHAVRSITDLWWLRSHVTVPSSVASSSPPSSITSSSSSASASIAVPEPPHAEWCVFISPTTTYSAAWFW
ncbi:uncharacterized protein EURHEDRAFT_237724 [Aspergillus ruber CBS 135680]|uniref:Uncharacterized protein n=1 Tax=Aspergillus ruber (strain CBS 135680) TaxID=1388766 RepID=A0A017S3S6_ASPRC|nr:uncharacterized protein EURHEDRAFT_237724 [Aspergillus ruber CBS 135680]EYE91572.1 hypothetical protein EURHEDRAFT_237724 [Aspergillus ruber CBS 135680]